LDDFVFTHPPVNVIDATSLPMLDYFNEIAAKKTYFFEKK